MTRVGSFVGVLAVLVLTSEAFAHKARIYNDTDPELEIKVFHFEAPSSFWDAGELDAGKKSSVVDLTHGNRILVAKDAIDDRVLLTQAFVAEDRGQRIRIKKKLSGELFAVFAVTVGDADP